MSCTFKDCFNDVYRSSDKCKFHKARKQCSIGNCLNIVYARNLCVRHGGKKKCKAHGCKSNAYGGDYCGQHGGIVSKRYCKQPDCTKQAHARGLCVRHGGGRICTAPGCSHHAREGGLCQKHVGDVAEEIVDETDEGYEPIALGIEPTSCLSQVEFLQFLDAYFNELPLESAAIHIASVENAQPVFII